MSHPLISAAALADALAGATPPQLLDCRARLGDADAGRRLWALGHLPQSQHLDLDRDLAAAPGKGGRHPLPTPAAFAARIQRLGITPRQPLVLYDDSGGQLAAARAWWMLARWAGHPDVRVLDGGLGAWQAAGGALRSGRVALPRASDWRPDYRDAAWVSAQALLSGGVLTVDARSGERFRGEVEAIDPVAGHIPGAVSRPSADNLTADGYFKSPSALAGELPAAEALVAYCGSGVTACHTILAYAVADRPLPRLYPGSWSEWIGDPSRPVATGE